MLDGILEEATNILGIPGQYGELDGAGWLVGFNDTDVVFVRHLADFGRISFEYQVGALTEHNREDVLSLLLRFNYFGSECAGMRTAITNDHVAFLVVDAVADHIQSNSAANIIGMLVENGPEWRKLVDAVARSGSAPDMAATGLPHPTQILV